MRRSNEIVPQSILSLVEARKDPTVHADPEAPLKRASSRLLPTRLPQIVGVIAALVAAGLYISFRHPEAMKTCLITGAVFILIANRRRSK
jgi:hypothetical protein